MRAGRAAQLGSAGCSLIGLTLTLAGCDPGPKPGTGAPPTSASASAPPQPSVAPSASAPPPYPRVPQTASAEPACRAVALIGDIKVGGAPLGNGAIVRGDTWLTLAKGASVVLRHTVSTREMSLKGPGLAMPCLEGGEDVLLSDGTFESTAGNGARPGAEVVIFTPVGTISYGDAQITIRASKSKVDVSTAKGEAWALPARGATRKGPEKVADSKHKTVLTGPGTAEPLLQECERAAEAAEGLARSVLNPAAADGGSLGERAAAHLLARKGARGACGVARAAANAEPDAQKRAGFEQRVEQAGRRWRSLGTPAAPPAKGSGE